MTRIYIARHGETEGILANRMESRLDSPLTDVGLKQASALENRLEDIPFTKIYSSPSQRAARTASIIKGNRSIDITLDDHLYELDIAGWDGRTRDDVAQADPILFEQFTNHPELFHPAQGENFQDLQKRVITFVTSIQVKHVEETILIVSHSGVIKMILDFVESKPLSEYRNRRSIPNGSLSIVSIEEHGAVVELEADVQHLQDLIMA
ncbi:histidine phosphatase family protein [Paenibacillus sp. S02]|uniref:histidine phosphatase family protein n=1 Tax=Paenibacillus sp. S02 TaxID=2823904 RepID=UPI001C64BA20|nr:histidine phosphatase family protein [Paenibacillus sp. S02]QYK67247.1 Adenosylcobalamin/alpha-ribazole phosphatase [Paenibacillus sp. S02]